MLGFAGLPGGYPKDEIDGIRFLQEFQATGTGYQQIQGTRPQTLPVGLTDSPVGLLAWIGEHLHRSTDNYPWASEEWITWTMLYWVQAGPAGGLRYYKENAVTGPPKDLELRAELGKLTSWSPTPHGFSWFPKDLPLPIDYVELNWGLF
ncbi:hypothetical protein RSOLAG22IIIB_06233 [Rhizoctonia solani]|uniref:Epoxide hydrolase n=1 Tax=Rhizoctonia solani TaxID=456999 RepID=A0A0K6GD03_9AGAM|nr:hypothetical protein RSOLAG22IIIB_06233 [Rhizoctonia solani]